MSIDEFLNRKYKFHKYDKYYDDYLKEIGNSESLYKILFKIIYLIASGLNFVARKVAKAMPSTIELLKISEHEYALVTTIPVKTWTQKFIPGEESFQNTMDGRTVRNIFEIESNALIEYQIETNRSIKIIRKFYEHEVKGEAEFKGVKSKHWCLYEK